MNLSIQRKLLTGFSSVLLIVVIVSISNYIQVADVSKIENRITKLRLPAVMAGIQLSNGIHLSLSGLRGYIILGDDPKRGEKFKTERKNGWALIDKSLAEMEQLSRQWSDQDSIQALQEIKTLVEEFRVAQQQVEDISHTPENIPSYKTLLSEAAPRAEQIIAALTSIIDEEAKQTATPARKELLKLLADSRGSFAVGLASIRAYLLSGDKKFADAFYEKWEINESSFKKITRTTGLFNTKQSQSWNTYKFLRSEFAPLPSKMFTLRAAKDWNLSNYWLGTKAAPKAEAIIKHLDTIRASQDEFAATDRQLLDSGIEFIDSMTIIGTLIILSLGVGIAIFISRMITVPLLKVVERAKLIANGNLVGAALEVKGNDEITELTGAVNTMNNNLKDIIKKITDSAEHIGRSSEELSAVTAQTSRNILEQQAQTEQAATAMTEMNATVQEVTKNITSTAQAAEEANNETKTGADVVDGAIQAVQQLGSQIENAAQVIHHLEQDSNNIGAVLDVIKSVAEQTNLLALNAAIEAARAGEQGRGFAVVADEVRTLAGKTQESTIEINQVIEKLQAGSRSAVEVMQKSREAHSVVELATNAGLSLSAISSAVANINGMSIQIASAAEQQSATAEEINRNIMSISTMANDTSVGAQQTESASADLARMAANLQGLTARFSI